MDGRGPAGASSRRHGLAVRRRALLCLAIALAIGPGASALAAGRPAADGASSADGALTTAEFDRSMLSGAGQNTTDLARFEHGNPVMPGVYRVDIYLNGAWVGRTDVRFAAASPEASATPCVSLALVRQLGLPLEKFSPAQQAALAASDRCVAFGDLVPSGQLGFDQPELRLDASVPQAWLGHRPRGYVAPAYWDAGVPAFLLNYHLNSYRSRNAGVTQTSAYLGLRAGINLGAWHLRHDAALTWQSALAGQSSRRQWQNIDTYLQRDIPAWRAQLTLGDAYTSGELFDSVRLRGARLATDDRMLPDSLRGYAPTVRGTAESNAKVSIRQNGVLIYETTVAPGPFVIDDLYPTGYGGDLQVSVTEATGRVRSFSVPYASVPQLLRAGTNRYDFAVGELHDAALLHTPLVAQATLQRGFNNLFTGYAGVVGSPGYAAALLGTALNTSWGAFAVDLTEARTQIPGHATQNGQSLRLSYSKTIPQTDTSLSVATYRYSTSGYLGLRDALLARDYARGGRFDAGTDPLLLDTLNGLDNQLPGVLTPEQRRLLLGSEGIDPLTGQPDRERSRFDLTLNQQLGTRGGALFATASARDYWNRRGTDVQFQLGYNNRLGPLSYSLSANRAHDVDGRYRNQYYLTFTLPLGDSGHAPTLTGSLGRDQRGHRLEQGTVNGVAGDASQFSYGATLSHAQETGSAASVFGGYRGSYAQLDASYGAGRGYAQSSFGAAGAVVAYPGGVSFGQSMGDTVGIVVAPDAAGARINNTAGLKVDRSGHALVPYLTPYTLNTIELDPKGLPLNVQLDETSAQVAPHAGAVVLLKYRTRSGRSLIVRLTQPGGTPVPFGSQVLDGKGQVLGVVGQAGRALVRGVGDAGSLTVQWQDEQGATRTCGMSYRLPPAASTQTYQQLSGQCIAGAAGPSRGAHE